MRICPFCGARAQTKEHVWPQWLREYPPYQLMRTGRHGQRFHQTEYVPDRGALTLRQQHIAEFLPNVVADVCEGCNNGWMSVMEAQVRALIGPLMQPGTAASPPPLDYGTQTLLAAWFSKCAYGYSAATLSEPNRPWTLDQFNALRERKAPAAHARIWIGRSRGTRGDVVLSLAPISLIPLTAGASHEPGRPGMASAWMSANGSCSSASGRPPT